MPRIRDVIENSSGILHYEVEKHKDIGEALRVFNKADVSAIVIIGGKAMASAIFEYLIEKNPLDGEIPPLAVLPAGDNNIVAEALGAHSPVADKELKRLLSLRKSGHLYDKVQSLPLMKVEGVRHLDRLYGLFFCAGDVVRNLNQSRHIFNRKFPPPGPLRHLKNRASMMKLMQKAYLNTLRARKLDQAMRINLNQRGAVVGQYFMVMMTMLDRVFLGIELDQINTKGGISYLSIENTSAAIMATGKQFLKRKYEPGKFIPGHIMVNIEHARIVLDHPFVLDGNFFEADETGEIHLSETVPLQFIFM